jgi:hypothetical protein
VTRALVLLLLLAGCAASQPPPPPAPAESGVSARIGGSVGGYYSHTR